MPSLSIVALPQQDIAEVALMITSAEGLYGRISGFVWKMEAPGLALTANLGEKEPSEVKVRHVS